MSDLVTVSDEDEVDGIAPSRPVVALLPGSRRAEVTRLLPDLLAAARILERRHPGLQFLVSRAGTVGLMQHKTSTARAVAEQLGVVWSPEALYDPSVNVLLGTCYLSQLLERFEDRDLA